VTAFEKQTILTHLTNSSTLTPQTFLTSIYTTQTPPGLPPHDLQLRVGAIRRIMRNFSIDKGLVKNTRCVITALGRHVVAVRKLVSVGSRNDRILEDILIPRITFTHSLESGHTLVRKQFPLTLAYASTFNSCQGLALDHVGIDLTRPAFSHGQLYTVLSRIKLRRGDACLFFNSNQSITSQCNIQRTIIRIACFYSNMLSERSSGVLSTIISMYMLATANGTTLRRTAV
jgi:hypothetical protein